MRKLFVSNLMSLDGYFESPARRFDFFTPDEEFFEYARKMLRTVDTIVFGRRTYEHMAAYWPSAASDEIAEKMNGLAKIVFSNTLASADWKNSTLIRGDAAQEMAKLKQAPGGDMVILGSAELASSLLNPGLIDEYRVIIDPILLGAGRTLFPNIKPRTRLRLEKVETLRSAVVILYYWPLMNANEHE